MSPREPSNPTTAVKRDHRQEVTDSIVKILEEGVAPWQKPWEPAGLPFNPTTEKAYRGGNAIHLMATALSRGYDDPRVDDVQAGSRKWLAGSQRARRGTSIEFWEVNAKSGGKRGSARQRGSRRSGNSEPAAPDPSRVHRLQRWPD